MLRWLQRFYHWLTHYSDIPVLDTDEPWTFIMRRNPHLLIVPSLAVYILAFLLMPDGLLGRFIVLGLLFFVAFLNGHVFWGSTKRRS